MIAEYLRKSRAEELMDDDSEVLAKHRDYLAKFAEQKGITVTDYYEEVVSGESIAARPEMQKLLTAVRAGKYHAVLCMDIDRLGRGGMQDQGTILDAFRDSGTLIITPDKTYDLSNEQDEMLTEFKSFMSRQEYKIIRKRMRRGLMQTVQAGGYCGAAPYGYKKCQINRKPSLEIVPEEAEVVKFIFKRYTDGLGGTGITDELNARGYRTRAGQAWTISSVRKIIECETYKGMIRWNKGRTIKPSSPKYVEQHSEFRPESEWLIYQGMHEAIVPPEVWDKAKQLRESRCAGIPRSKGNRIENPLAGLLICSKCGKKIQQHQPQGRVKYYHCLTRGCCAACKVEYVEQSVITALMEKLQILRTRAATEGKPDTSAYQAELKMLSAETRKQETRKNRLFEFLEDGTYSREVFRARMQEADERIAAIEARKAEVEHLIEQAENRDLNKIIQQLQDLLDVYWQSDAKTKNKLLKSLIEKIIYSKEKGSKKRDFTIEIVSSFFM